MTFTGENMCFESHRTVSFWSSSRQATQYDSFPMNVRPSISPALPSYRYKDAAKPRETANSLMEIASGLETVFISVRTPTEPSASTYPDNSARRQSACILRHQAGSDFDSHESPKLLRSQCVNGVFP